MALQKIRADVSQQQPDGATIWCACWMGGKPIAKIMQCRWASLAGEPRVTAYAQGDADTFFSVPAKCRYAGKTVTGYITQEDSGNLVFHHCYY